MLRPPRSVRLGRRFAALAVGLALTLLAGPVVPAAAAGDVEEPAVQALLDDLVEVGVPGLTASIRSENGVWRGAAGAAVLEPLVPMLPSARYRIGSVTKTFVATVVLQLVGEEVLDLGDTLESRLPGTGIANAEQITVRQLLNHTAGVFNYTDDPGLFTGEYAELDEYLPPALLVEIAAAQPALFPPGEGWYYSNTGYVLLGLIVEEATGNSLRTELHERIFEPLRLRQTSLPDDPPLRGYHAHGYEPDWALDNPEPPPPDVDLVDATEWSPSWAWASGAMVSAQRDIERFFRALLQGGLLPSSLLQEMLATVPISPTAGYGLGIMQLRGPCGTVVGHTGGVPGYVNVAYLSPDGSRFTTVMSNLTPFTPALGELLDLTVTTSVCQMYGAPEPGVGLQALGTAAAYAPPVEDFVAPRDP